MLVVVIPALRHHRLDEWPRLLGLPKSGEAVSQASTAVAQLRILLHGDAVILFRIRVAFASPQRVAEFFEVSGVADMGRSHFKAFDPLALAAAPKQRILQTGAW